MLDLNSEFGKHVLERLHQEQVVWLTTVNQRSAPQPNPVWFYWDGEAFLVYTKPESVKLKNINRNNLVALNFEGADVTGGDVVIFEAEAIIEPHGNIIDPGYADKYRVAADALGYQIEDLYKEYSVTLRIKPNKVRTL